MTRDLKILLAGENVLLASNTNIEMSWSYKYKRDGLIGLITSSGMKLIEEHTSTYKKIYHPKVKKIVKIMGNTFSH